MALQNSGGVRHAIMKPFYDGVLRHPLCLPPKGNPHTSIFHGATESSEGGSLCRILRALSMRSRSPYTTAFYAIPSVHRQKDVPIQVFPMALQSLLKGESICRVFLDVWKVLTLKPDSGGIRHAIMKPFYDGALRHPLCPPPKRRLHTSIFHGATDQIPGALDSGGVRHVIMKPFSTAFYAIPSVHRQKDVPIQPFSMALQNSGGVRHAIMKPFYDGVLQHPNCPPPKGHPHTSIFHGATDSSEGGIPGALGMRLWSPFMTAFYAIKAVHC
ncbi:hypothetical protein B9Z19DRAFT_1196693 [Tuber borchii]|uniref:Uncharacterized protein n=1 Tax=Tuber borchii TaxID=42251 RepID=A0A2T6ZE91_TUBBO|nr:hypothetical protein B9Z19DRAFT_1196693 [Tuber borchii]